MGKRELLKNEKKKILSRYIAAKKKREKQRSNFFFLPFFTSMEALAQLKQYYEQGFISQEDYDKKRTEIINAVQRGVKVRFFFLTINNHFARDASFM